MNSHQSQKQPPSKPTGTPPKPGDVPSKRPTPKDPPPVDPAPTPAKPVNPKA